MEINFLAVIVAGLSTMVIGSVWYNEKVFGAAWMRETGMTKEKAKGANLLKIFGLSILFAIMIAFVMQFMVIHQFGAMGMVGGDIEAAKPSYEAFMADYEHSYRTFKHGMLHGAMVGVFMGLPIVGTNALYEMKSGKYILINSGYWIICFAIMGGIICAWK